MTELRRELIDTSIELVHEANWMVENCRSLEMYVNKNYQLQSKYYLEETVTNLYKIKAKINEIADMLDDIEDELY